VDGAPQADWARRRRTEARRAEREREAQGLVLCHITGRDLASTLAEGFPSPELVDAAAGLFIHADCLASDFIDVDEACVD
jgi:hypothetical protein